MGDLGRCDYCGARATARISYDGYLATGRRRYVRCHVRACAKHEGCVNWDGMRRLHPDAPVERAAP
jgi:hypothetical protein